MDQITTLEARIKLELEMLDDATERIQEVNREVIDQASGIRKELNGIHRRKMVLLETLDNLQEAAVR